MTDRAQSVAPAGTKRGRGKPPARPPVHPGRLLQKLVLSPLRLNQSEAARRLGISRRRLHEVVNGRRRMTPDTAVRCAAHFGGDAEFWLSLQSAFDGFIAHQRLRGSRG